MVPFKQLTPLDLARIFHNTYERLAPQYGYKTRDDTKQFDRKSANGKLMQAVCAEILTSIEDETYDDDLVNEWHQNAKDQELIGNVGVANAYRECAEQLEKRDNFMLKVMRLVDKWDLYDDLFWRVNEGFEPLTFVINCNDFFYWGTADAEEITEDNIDELEKALIDADSVLEHGHVYGALLWCARVRGMRPQGAAYPKYKELWPLFDECGPEREINIVNPKPAPRT